MNILPDEKIELLAEAFEERRSLRVAARRCGVNRETALRYFRHFESGGALDTDAGPIPIDPVIAIAGNIGRPEVVSQIDNYLRQLAVELEDLYFLRRCAIRRHGERPNQS